MAQLIGRIQELRKDLDAERYQGNPILMEMLSDIIRSVNRLSSEYNDNRYSEIKPEYQLRLLQTYNALYERDPQGTIAYLQQNVLIRDEINEAFNVVPNAMALVAVTASNAFREAFRKILRPGPFPPLPVPIVVGLTGPGATDYTLRQNIINMFGAGGENLLRHLTAANMGIYAPGMYARYQARYGAFYPVTVVQFGNNILDYLVHKVGGKKQRRSIIKKRKSNSKKRKNGRKSNKRRV